MRSSQSCGFVVVGLAGAVLILLAGQAFGDSYVRYTLEVGGDNHSDQWHAAVIPCFSFSGSATPSTVKNCTAANAGSNADGRYFNKGTDITWAVLAESGGVQTMPVTNHPAHGYATWGAANIVFDLALYKDSIAEQNLADTADFKSTMNDGIGTNPITGTANITTNAAFAISYKVWGTSAARLIDTYPKAGPYLNPALSYPYDGGDGKLIGMGAGYHKWQRSTTNDKTTPGIGLVTLPNTTTGLGIVPVAEGQIGTANLVPGTYIIEVKPGKNNNVLRGGASPWDLTNTTDREVFAVASNASNGDTIMFILCDPGDPTCGPPAVTGWSSVRTHGTCGEKAIVLSGSGVTAEPRMGGIQKIRVVFTKAVTAPTGTIQAVPSSNPSSPIAASSTSLSPDGKTLDILFNEGVLPDMDCYTIDLAGRIADLSGDTNVKVRALVGEVEDDDTVALGDALAVNGNNGRPACTDEEYAKYDIDTNGVITLGDALLVNMMNGSSTSCP